MVFDEILKQGDGKLATITLREIHESLSIRWYKASMISPQDRFILGQIHSIALHKLCNYRHQDNRGMLGKVHSWELSQKDSEVFNRATKVAGLASDTKLVTCNILYMSNYMENLLKRLTRRYIGQRR